MTFSVESKSFRDISEKKVVPKIIQLYLVFSIIYTPTFCIYKYIILPGVCCIVFCVGNIMIGSSLGSIFSLPNVIHIYNIYICFICEITFRILDHESYCIAVHVPLYVQGWFLEPPYFSVVILGQ